MFTPSILTILGVVMYLRFGWVVGQSGLAWAIAIVVVAHLITIATGLSVSSIATNRTVRAGGAYYLISRSLGAPVGAAVGIPLFFGQALSVSFYSIGFAESVSMFLPGTDLRITATVMAIVLTAVSFKSADLAIKTQYFVMAAILLSLVSFFLGRAETPPASIAWTNPDGAPFQEVFAVFFPAVTGIMAGIGMSGDLKDPRRSLPTGTMLAIFVGLVVYLVVPVWLAMNATTAELIADPNIMWSISLFPAALYAGVWGATLSSAAGSILTAPRTLQALAADGLAPRFFAKGHGPANEPRRGTIFAFILAQGGILIGDLNLIANILTMFFLATYGITNLACGLERWAASPSFRPDFRVPAWVSLAGATACFYVMSIIDLTAMLVAFAVSAGIFVVASRRALGGAFGDARHGIWAALVRASLHRLRRTEFHALNWRPNLIILGGGTEKRPHLLRLGATLVQAQGIVTYFQLLKGSVDELAETRKQLIKAADNELLATFPGAFYRVDIVDELYQGMVQVCQSYGVGNFEANTVMLGWPKKLERAEAYARMMRDMVALERSLLLIRHDEDKQLGAARQIHIWWGGLEGNGGLMLLLAFLLSNHELWRRAQVTVLTVVDTVEEQTAAETAIKDILASARLEGVPRVVLRADRTIADVMRYESEFADLAMVGVRLPPAGEAEEFFRRMNTMLEALPTTIVVRSSDDFQGAPVLFG